MFDYAPKSLVDKVEQVARLIRSKGVGVYFVTQNPADVPEDIFGPIGAIVCNMSCAPIRPRISAPCGRNLRDNPRFNTQDSILQVGEAASSFLEKRGCPVLLSVL